MSYDVTYSHDLARLTGEPVRVQQARKSVRTAFHEVTADLPPRTLEALQVEETVSEGGLALSGRHVVEVFVGGLRATRIHPSARDTWRAKRGDRGRYVYYVQGGTLYVKPQDSQTRYAYLIEDPTWTADAATLDMPRPLHELYVTWAAVRLLEERMRVLQGRFPDQPLGYPDAPTPPGAPSLSVPQLSTSGLGPDETTIEALPSPPTLTPPSDREPSGSEVTVGSITLPTLPTFSDSITLSSAPSYSPSTTFPAPPNYNGPTDLSLSFSDFETRETKDDVEMAAVELNRLRTEIEEFQAQTEEALGAFQAEVQAYRAEVEEEVQAERIELDAYGADVQKYGAESDALISEFNAAVREYQADVQAYAAEVEAEVQAFRAEVQAELQKYESEGSVKGAFQRLELEGLRAELEPQLADYEAEVQRRIQQAQIIAQEAAQTAQETLDVNTRNAARQVETEARQYQLELERFQGQLAVYQGEIEGLISEQTAEIERRQQRARMMQYDVQRLRRQYQEKKSRWLNRYHKAPTITPSGPLPLS